MNEILKKHIKGETVTDADIAEALSEICESVRPECDAECPAFKIFGRVPMKGDMCLCRADGHAMLTFIRKKLVEGWIWSL